MPPRLGEADLIARYFAPLAGPAGLDLRDDAALMRPPAGEDLVVTTDALVAGVHFLADDPPGQSPARRCGSISPILPPRRSAARIPADARAAPDWRDDWLAAFADGLGADISAFKCPLLAATRWRRRGP